MPSKNSKNTVSNPKTVQVPVQVVETPAQKVNQDKKVETTPTTPTPTTPTPTLQPEKQKELRDTQKELEFQAYIKNTKRSKLFKDFPLVKEGIGYSVRKHKYPYDVVSIDHIIIPFDNMLMMYAGYASDLFVTIKEYIQEGYVLFHLEEEDSKAKNFTHWHLIKYK